MSPQKSCIAQFCSAYTSANFICHSAALCWQRLDNLLESVLHGPAHLSGDKYRMRRVGPCLGPCMRHADARVLYDVMALHVQGHSLIRVLRIAAPECTPPQAWAGHSTCLETPSASLALATVQLSNDVLQRPRVSQFSALAMQSLRNVCLLGLNGRHLPGSLMHISWRHTHPERTHQDTTCGDETAALPMQRSLQQQVLEMILLAQVSLEGSPVVHQGSAHGSHAAKIGMQAWQDMREGKGVMSSQQCDDSSGIADKIALLKLPGCPEGESHGATCALILASHGDDAVGALYCMSTKPASVSIRANFLPLQMTKLKRHLPKPDAANLSALWRLDTAPVSQVFLPHERRPSPAAESSPNPAASSAEGDSPDTLGTRPEAANTETAVDVNLAVERLGSLFGMEAQQSKAAYGKAQQHALAAVSNQVHAALRELHYCTGLDVHA